MLNHGSWESPASRVHAWARSHTITPPTLPFSPVLAEALPAQSGATALPSFVFDTRSSVYAALYSVEVIARNS